MNPWLPWVSNDVNTKYGPAIIQAVLLIIKYQKINSCVLFFSDGGQNPIPTVEASLFIFVKNCHHCTVCAVCFFVKKYSSTPTDNVFRNTCSRMGATFYAHHDPWILIWWLRNWTYNAIYNNRPHCKCPHYKWW